MVIDPSVVGVIWDRLPYVHGLLGRQDIRLRIIKDCPGPRYFSRFCLMRLAICWLIRTRAGKALLRLLALKLERDSRPILERGVQARGWLNAEGRYQSASWGRLKAPSLPQSRQRSRPLARCCSSASKVCWKAPLWKAFAETLTAKNSTNSVEEHSRQMAMWDPYVASTRGLAGTGLRRGHRVRYLSKATCENTAAGWRTNFSQRPTPRSTAASGELFRRGLARVSQPYFAAVRLPPATRRLHVRVGRPGFRVTRMLAGHQDPGSAASITCRNTRFHRGTVRSSTPGLTMAFLKAVGSRFPLSTELHQRDLLPLSEDGFAWFLLEPGSLAGIGSTSCRRTRRKTCSPARVGSGIAHRAARELTTAYFGSEACVYYSLDARFS